MIVQRLSTIVTVCRAASAKESAMTHEEGTSFNLTSSLLSSLLWDVGSSHNMPRSSKMAARAARRAAMTPPNLPGPHKKRKTRLDDGRRTCCYCSKTLKCAADRDRHITLRPYCRSRHMLATDPRLTKLREHKRKRNEDGTDLDEPHDTHADSSTPPSKLPRVDDAPPSHEQSQGLDANLAGQGDSELGGGANERICGDPFVEKFPIATAGEPISTAAKPEPDLRAYVESCGNLRDPDLFDIAELLMMTVPKGKDRTKHLKSKPVSSHK